MLIYSNILMGSLSVLMPYSIPTRHALLHLKFISTHPGMPRSWKHKLRRNLADLVLHGTDPTKKDQREVMILAFRTFVPLEAVEWFDTS